MVEWRHALPTLNQRIPPIHADHRLASETQRLHTTPKLILIRRWIAPPHAELGQLLTRIIHRRNLIKPLARRHGAPPPDETRVGIALCIKNREQHSHHRHASQKSLPPETAEPSTTTTTAPLALGVRHTTQRRNPLNEVGERWQHRHRLIRLARSHRAASVRHEERRSAAARWEGLLRSSPRRHRRTNQLSPRRRFRRLGVGVRRRSRRRPGSWCRRGCGLRRRRAATGA
jgi:hypothetical protein